MSRIRSIKPTYNRSLDIVPLSIPCRYHFSILWTYADDSGRGLDHPSLIKAELWPLDADIDETQIELWMTELAAHGRIIRYAVDGRRYFEIVNFTEHQHPQKPQASKFPPPSDDPPTPPPTGPLPDRSSNGSVAVSEGAGPSSGGLSPVVVEVEGGEQEQEGSPRGTSPQTEDRLVHDAVTLLLQRDGTEATATTKQHPARWLAGAHRGRYTDHRDEALRLLRTHPHWNAAELANALEAPPPEPPPRETHAETAARHAREREHFTGPGNFDEDAAQAGIAAARAARDAAHGAPRNDAHVDDVA